MKPVIRSATVDDAADVVQLIAEHAALYDEASLLTESFVRRYLASPASEILVAEVDQQVVGLLSCSLRPDLFHAADSCLVEDLVVREGRRGQGIGRALMSELFARLEARDCAEVSVGVMQDNLPAINLYRSLGLCEEALLLEMHLAPKTGAAG